MTKDITLKVVVPLLAILGFLALMSMASYCAHNTCDISDYSPADSQW